MLLAVFGVTAVTLQPDFVIQDFTLRSSPIPAILYQQPLLQASSNVPTPTPASNLVSIQSQGVTQADLNNRITGLLLHMHWLLNDRGQSATVSTARTNSSESKRIDRLERQIFSFMDDSNEDRSDLSDTLTTNGTFLTPTLTTALLNGTTTANALVTTGWLGVGTSSPVERLSVNGAVYLADTTPTNSASRLYNTAGGLYWNGSLVAGGAVGNWTGSGSDVYRASGNVGIGTSSPLAKLSVTGSGTGTGRAFSITDSTNAEKFTVLDNGNVGIGTSTPDERLTVTGRIHINNGLM